MKFRVGLIGSVVAVVLLPRVAFGHGVLRSSVPVAKAELKVAPSEIRLTFNEDVSLAGSRIEVTGGTGAVALDGVHVAAGMPRTLVASVRGLWTAGVHMVRWQVAGRDGHPVRGEFTFTLLPEGVPAQVPPISPPPTPSTAPSAPLAAPEAAGVGAPGFVAIRWLTFASILVLLGAVVFSRLAETLPETAAAAALERSWQLGHGAAAAALVLSVGRLGAQVLAFDGNLGDADLARDLVGGSVWGWGWGLQFGAALMLLWTFGSGRSRKTPHRVAAIGVLGMALTPALSGHAATGGALAVMVDWMHVTGAGGWLGTLLLLLAAGLPAIQRLPDGERDSALAALVGRFSRVALVCAALVAVTGVLRGWQNIGSWDGLVASTYGQILLLKIAVLSIVGATGAWNWRVVTPRLGTPAGTAQLRRVATIELSVAVLVVLVTAVLVATPAPVEAPMASATAGLGTPR